MPAKKSVVRAGLCKKGFLPDRKTAHEYYRYITSKGERTKILVCFSHGAEGNEIADKILGKMAKQCKLTRRQFDHFVDCQMSVEQYEDHLAERRVWEAASSP
jgi:hypothetical protein